MSRRQSRRRLLVIAAAGVLLLSGCATVPRRLAPGGLRPHGTVAEEWGPHRGVVEWWYLTGVLEGGEGGPYLVQFTIFHLDFKSGPIYMLHLACTDYATGGHLFEQQVSLDDRTAFAAGDSIIFGDSSIALQPGSLRTVGRGKDIDFDLTFRLSSPPVWHGRNGLISMGHPEDPGQQSYYYSFVRLQTSGWLSCSAKGLASVRRQMEGWSWFDRQWGTFGERAWDWFSLRFSDGDRIMLFCFPKTGHFEGTWVRADGTASAVSDFTYSVERRLKRGGHHYGLGWRLELPMKEGSYRVVPLSLEDFNPNPANDYWEGLCRLLDANGESAGWCVAETTGSAHGP